MTVHKTGFPTIADPGTAAMTETATAPAESTTSVEHPAPAEEHLFDRQELIQFGADDVEAGQNICKMLSLFFFYTVIVMALSTYITWRWIYGG
jgi:hypothetical protein